MVLARIIVAGIVVTSVQAQDLEQEHIMRPFVPGPTAQSSSTAVAPPPPLIYKGGPVQNAPVVYVVFWGWTSDPYGVAPYLTSFLSSVGGNPWLNTVVQYGGGNPTNLYGGSWFDNINPIPDQPSMADLKNEAIAAINHFGLGTSVNIQIIVATPTGHSTPGFLLVIDPITYTLSGGEYCAKHGPLTAFPNVTFTDLPYLPDNGNVCQSGSGSPLSGVSIAAGHELAEVITDPLPGVNSAWRDSAGDEIGDKCLGNLVSITTPNGTFVTQALWSNAANDCVSATPIFTSGPHSGDVDGDGKFTLGDLLLVQRYVLHEGALTANQFQNADVYPVGGDGEVTFADWLALQQKILYSNAH